MHTPCETVNSKFMDKKETPAGAGVSEISEEIQVV